MRAPYKSSTCIICIVLLLKEVSCLLDCDGVEGGGKRSLRHCSGCEMPKIIEVEGVVMGKVGGEGVNWG